MIVTFSPGQLSDLNGFFKGDASYLDLMITRDSIILIANNSELYMHRVFSVLTRESFSQTVVARVDRSKFLKLLCEGVISIYYNESDRLKFTFKPSEGGEYSWGCVYQASDISAIDIRNKILQKTTEFVPLPLHRVEDVLGLVRKIDHTLLIQDKVLYANHRSIQIFHRIECEDVCLPIKHVSYLLKHSDDIYKYQDYVIGLSSGKAIIINQWRSDAAGDLDYILGQTKHSHYIKTDVSAIAALLGKCDNVDHVVMDFDLGNAYNLEGKDQFSTKFKVKEIRSAKAKKKLPSLATFNFNEDDDGEEISASIATLHKTPRLVVPSFILTDVLTSSLLRDLTVKIKREFIQLEDGKKKFYLVFGRREVD